MLLGLTPDEAIELGRLLFAVLAVVAIVFGVGMVAWQAVSNRVRLPFIMGAAALVFVTGLAFNAPYTNDDTLIFLRYAENAAAGLGLVYNPGEQCEGFTSIVWLGLLTLGAMMGKALVSAKILGGMFGLLAVWLTVMSVRRLVKSTLAIAVTAVVAASSQLLWSWSESGMDAALFVAWEAALLYVILTRSVSAGIRWTVFALGPWIRPEGSIVLLAAWLVSTWSHRAVITRRRQLLGSVAIVALLLAPLLARQFVFGEWVPNTFYAKSDRSLRNGLGFLIGAANEINVLVWLVSITGLWKLRREFGWIGLLLVLMMAGSVYVGGDVLIHRFMVFWLPMIWVGFAVGMDLALERLRQSGPILAVAAVLLLVSQEIHRSYRVTKPSSNPEGYGFVAASAIATAETDELIGRYLANHGASTQTVVTDNIGAIGYHSGMQVLDVNGLTDRSIAGLIRDGRTTEIESLTRERRPEWIVCYPGPHEDPDRYRIVRIGTFGGWIRSDYEPVGTWHSRTGYTRVLLKRREEVSGRNAAPQN